MTREEILNDEFLRPQPAALRPLSVGVLALARKLGLSLAMSEPREVSEEDRAQEVVMLAWLLDSRHSLEEIKLAAAEGRERFLAQRLDAYQFALHPSQLIAVQQEFARTNAAIEQALFSVQPKPSSGDAPSVPGNS